MVGVMVGVIGMIHAAVVIIATISVIVSVVAIIVVQFTSITAAVNRKTNLAIDSGITVIHLQFGGVCIAVIICVFISTLGACRSWSSILNTIGVVCC